MRVLRTGAAEVVCAYCARVSLSILCTLEGGGANSWPFVFVFYRGAVVSDGQLDLLCHVSLPYKVENQQLRHLTGDQLSFLCCVRFHENLSGTEGV